MRPFLLYILCLLAINSNSQPVAYTTANAHSHNDYEQKVPFHTAYNEQFGSIEADIHLVKGQLLVGHDPEDLKENRTLENMYLVPLIEYNDKNRKLQILIDLKTEAISTLNALVTTLKKYPAIIESKSIRIVVTGNKPNQKQFGQYPDFIWFDGNLNENYTAGELKKIAMLSADFGSYTKGNNALPILNEDRKKIIAAIDKGHKLKKPVRFWGGPDSPEAWEEMINLKVDYINTDHIHELSDFLTNRNKSVRLLPYNRIIRSAGEVIRYGQPELENHALDVAILEKNSLVVVEDRYGIFIVDINSKKIVGKWSFGDMPDYSGYMSTYSGIKTFQENGKTWIVWSAVGRTGGQAALMIAEWDKGIRNVRDIQFETLAPADNAIPNEIAIARENNSLFLYVVLNGNNELLKIDWNTQKIIWKTATGVAPYGLTIANNKIYVSNWAGETATDSLRERAGVPWGLAYTDPRTGATAGGTVSVFDITNGKQTAEIRVGLHPNAIRASNDGKFIYVANGSSDEVSVINSSYNSVSETIFVGRLRGKESYQGSTPNGLELNEDNSILYVSNGMDNAVAVVHLGKNASSTGKNKSSVIGYIPTEAYPAGLKLTGNSLVVANLEADGANVIDQNKHARQIHNELASISIIPVPDKPTLEIYTQEVAQLNLMNRMDLLSLPPRTGVAPVPVPERLGEPSVFKHVVYIIKENKTYDQVFGDMQKGRSDSSLCVFGEKVTPNTHALARQFGWMDDYNASGKSSAEGHQWTDAGMVSDYVEKNVRAWFRSYPHRQADALVYNKNGFIWNQALDYGKKVRIYGEACTSIYDPKLKWIDIYNNYKAGKKPVWTNTSTIARILPVISPTYPDCDNITFTDQYRADIFINEWKQYEQGDSLPDLLLLSLPNDHSAGTSPDFPTPNAMVADNDLALGRIIETITKSKYWDSTVIFVTEDDSQSGWDHISAYRTIGLTISPYSNRSLVSAHYNQTSMLRTIEQILGIPPMNIMDATARLMTDCFQNKPDRSGFTAIPNNIPLDQMNLPLQSLRGRAKKLAEQSQNEVFNEVDGGKDDEMNKIIWAYAKGKRKYPKRK
ncbi:alkaline phosphatase family protein [Flavihumibacter profundi]|uniref:alkaline phosphatase family protein n=1 Tax=Flavihumibacter profundi TaxID=2716883 RepID=UPI001CC817D9|nr:alkaline phosphatase family protein [Flavihumibacter profundi]MBZ5858710.1 beta-propeller fold lactonase family protein [Flavihumibacter profundi]